MGNTSSDIHRNRITNKHSRKKFNKKGQSQSQQNQIMHQYSEYTNWLQQNQTSSPTSTHGNWSNAMMPQVNQKTDGKSAEGPDQNLRVLARMQPYQTLFFHRQIPNFHMRLMRKFIKLPMMNMRKPCRRIRLNLRLNFIQKMTSANPNLHTQNMAWSFRRSIKPIFHFPQVKVFPRSNILLLDRKNQNRTGNVTGRLPRIHINVVKIEPNKFKISSLVPLAKFIKKRN